MPSKNLRNKPLVEAILELKWALTSPAQGIQIDTHYKILLGRLYDRVSNEYPEHEQLPTAMVPDEFAGQVVQHRFRRARNDWPLLQLGPGILTVNETNKYIWDDFRPRCIAAVTKLFEAHPKQSDLKIEGLLLRYINAIEVDPASQNIFAFLKEKMRIDIALPEDLFKNAHIRKHPQFFNWQSSFACEKPKGIVNARFATGLKEERPALIWETMVHSGSQDIPVMPHGFVEWISAAHDITDDWFFKLIEGDLERRFSGE